MDSETKPFGQAAATALTAAAASLEPATKPSTSSDETAHRRHFVQTFSRWVALFKRSDSGSVEADKWLIAEYFKSLGHLTPQGLETLTEELKARCTFFPTIRECLEIINPPKYSYASPFYQRPGLFHAPAPPLAAPAKQIGHGR